MNIQLRSFEHGPTTLPVWQTMLDDLGDPPQRVARFLGISERSAYRYKQAGYAPKPCQLAVFWLTRWGMSLVDANAVNDARVAVGYVESLRSELERTRAQLTKLELLGSFG